MTNDDQGHRSSFSCHVTDSGDMALSQLLVLVRDRRRGLSALTSDVNDKRRCGRMEVQQLVFAGPVRWTGKKTEIGLNPTAKDRTTGCGCTNSEFFRLPVAMFVEKSKNRKKPV